MTQSLALQSIIPLNSDAPTATVEYFTQSNVSITVRFYVGMPLLRSFSVGIITDIVGQNITIQWRSGHINTLVPCVNYAGNAISAVYEGLKNG